MAPKAKKRLSASDQAGAKRPKIDAETNSLVETKAGGAKTESAVSSSQVGTSSANGTSLSSVAAAQNVAQHVEYYEPSKLMWSFRVAGLKYEAFQFTKEYLYKFTNPRFGDSVYANVLKDVKSTLVLKSTNEKASSTKDSKSTSTTSAIHLPNAYSRFLLNTIMHGIRTSARQQWRNPNLEPLIVTFRHRGATVEPVANKHYKKDMKKYMEERAREKEMKTTRAYYEKSLVSLAKKDFSVRPLVLDEDEKKRNGLFHYQETNVDFHLDGDVYSRPSPHGWHSAGQRVDVLKAWNYNPEKHISSIERQLFLAEVEKHFAKANESLTRSDQKVVRLPNPLPRNWMRHAIFYASVPYVGNLWFSSGRRHDCDDFVPRIDQHERFAPCARRLIIEQKPAPDRLRAKKDGATWSAFNQFPQGSKKNLHAISSKELNPKIREINRAILAMGGKFPENQGTPQGDDVGDVRSDKSVKSTGSGSSNQLAAEDHILKLWKEYDAILKKNDLVEFASDIDSAGINRISAPGHDKLNSIPSQEILYFDPSLHYHRGGLPVLVRKKDTVVSADCADHSPLPAFSSEWRIALVDLEEFRKNLAGEKTPVKEAMGADLVQELLIKDYTSEWVHLPSKNGTKNVGSTAAGNAAACRAAVSFESATHMLGGLDSIGDAVGGAMGGVVKDDLFTKLLGLIHELVTAEHETSTEGHPPTTQLVSAEQLLPSEKNQKIVESMGAKMLDTMATSAGATSAGAASAGAKPTGENPNPAAKIAKDIVDTLRLLSHDDSFEQNLSVVKRVVASLFQYYKGGFYFS